MALPSFAELLKKVRGSSWVPPHRLLSLDPGETIGWGFFVDGVPKACGQIKNSYSELEKLIDQKQPTHLVFEEYVLYPWKKNEQAWSDFPVAQLIGAIRYMCYLRSIEVIVQGADQAKGFVSDTKLIEWGLFQQGRNHANDALRHGCYCLIWHGRRDAPARPRDKQAAAAFRNKGSGKGFKPSGR